MANEGVNNGRRRFLTTSTAVVGGVGVATAAYAFLSSWKPSARAQSAGAPVEVDISRLDTQPGARLTVQWRGKPVWIFRRTEAQLAVLPGLAERLADPDSENADQTPAFARNLARSIKPDIGVLVGICTHLGCSPMYVPELQPQAFDSEWQGGFFCPCHNSRFDIAGRVFAGVPAPSNLPVPPHHFDPDNPNLVIIGIAPEEVA
ncbi:MAG: ubiquinol-cytochrome c reductase iron-sulfur subunit [Xanthomonadaceae bacterium]|jgi:ubiquinol-cytochrome c reductase iron-sulfur subunit|nr:ubiquinol-cytochrome c reductase iron-sulfur subunit [Xanthomonadaceae bacterium]